MISTSTVANNLKETLEEVITDRGDEGKMVAKQWIQEKSMSDFYEDDLEVAGPGLASEKQEGAEIATGTIREGYITRYISRTLALKMIVSREALEDSKYKQVIDAAKRLRRAMYKTIDIDTTNILVRGFNSAFAGGDGQPLWSNAHTLANGGTFSNLMGTPVAPSKIAFATARAATLLYPGHDGITEGYDITTVIYPVAQWEDWEELTKSKYDPVTNNFAKINVVEQQGLKLVRNKYWNNTTTNYAFLTDAPDKINIRYRRKPSSDTWNDNDQHLMKYAISARWARGWSDPRCTFGVNAT